MNSTQVKTNCKWIPWFIIVPLPTETSTIHAQLSLALNSQLLITSLGARHAPSVLAVAAVTVSVLLNDVQVILMS